MNKSQQFAIGVDIGGTGTKFGIVNHRGDITYKGDIPTNQFQKVEDFVEALYNTLVPAIESVGRKNIKGMGVGAPNGNYYTGTIDYAPNLHWRGIIPLAKLITDRFDIPCSLTNDANAAAVGEMNYGVARGMK